MNKLSVCFVGVGSIAKRHIKNLRCIGIKRNISFQIDAVRHNGCSEDEKREYQFGKVYSNVRDIEKIYDIMFITNPTEYHLDILRFAENKAKHFFIEKPISTYEKLHNIDNMSFNEDSIYYVASPLRYNSVIRYVKENINIKDVVAVRCISSSYLPDWRPGVDYRTTYSAQKSLGGGVSIDLIHEWDYLMYLFGKPQQIKSMVGKKSKLEIDSDDYAIYIAEYSDKIVELHLDYFGRVPIRKIELMMTDDTIIGDIINHKIYFLKSEKIIELNEDRDVFQKRELEFFLDAIDKNIKLNEINHAMQVLKLTQGEI